MCKDEVIKVPLRIFIRKEGTSVRTPSSEENSDPE